MAISISEYSHESAGHKLYDVEYYDDSILTTVTADPGAVADWIYVIERIHRRRLRYLVVGLDVEWRPNYQRGGQRNPVATLQLCVGRRCLIYQIYHSPYIPDELTDFLSDYNYTFVGVGVFTDIEKLQADYGIGGDAVCVDLRDLAADEYERETLRNAGLRGLADAVLERELEKPQHVRTSRWDNRWLTAEQVQYAAVDAFVSFEVGRILNASDYTYDD